MDEATVATEIKSLTQGQMVSKCKARVYYWSKCKSGPSITKLYDSFPANHFYIILVSENIKKKT